jgi:uncharacterized protein (DUF4415 family)
MKNFSTSGRPLSPEQLERLAQLEAMPDEEIDYSDIPPMTAEQWADPRRPAYYKNRKRPVTMRMDADLVDWFKHNAGDKPYQTEINRVLRAHMEQSQQKQKPDHAA